MLSDEFLSCDWGTSSFRLRRVRRSDLDILAEISESAGAKSIFEAFPKPSERAARYAEVLTAATQKLLEKPAAGQSPIPLVISGMASSSIGWKELPYARLPFRLSGAGLVFEKLDWPKPKRISTTYLISGAAHETDMMRGEETEIVGLMANESLDAARQNSLVVLPGTHSKHIGIHRQNVVDFQTYLTGELFEVLTKHSILRASIFTGEMPAFDPAAQAAFQAGAVCACDHGISMSLFRIRTRDVLQGLPPEENTWFLSGVLIGAEVESLMARAESIPIVLAATSRFAAPYRLALETLAGAADYADWIQLSPDEVERATITAHALFLEQYEDE